jgi:REP element-mobilizing transposase RayT
MTFSRRRLPHWQTSGQPLFLTWHLHGSLPRNRFPPPSSGSAGKAFVWMDRYLDEARSGPTWLQKEEIAQLVLRSLQYAGDSLQFYTFHAWVIMSNHVHLLVAPRVEPERFLQSVKGYTAREANRLLRRTGEPFWQGESYDRWIRDQQEFERVRKYIEYNPVRAGLAASPEQYRWSSAYAGPDAGVAG